MARIIPWKLPDVAGGSIGGYTPAPTPEPPTPDPDPLYINVESVSVDGNFTAYITSTSFTRNVEKSVSVNSADLVISGIEIVNIIGVSQIVAKVEFAKSVLYWSYDSDDLKLDIDVVTLASSVISGTINATYTGSNATETKDRFSIQGGDVSAITFYVYNGNGEVIQTAEVSLA